MNLVVFIYASLILFSMSVLPLFMKQLSQAFSDMQVLFIISLLLTLVSLTFLLIRGEFSGVIEVTLSRKYFAFLILVVAFLMFLDTWPYIKALQAGADVSILLSYVRAGGTLFTALLGVYILGEKLTPHQWVGILLCVCGIVLILLFKHPEKL